MHQSTEVEAEQKLFVVGEHAQRLLKLAERYCQRPGLPVNDAFGYMALSLVNKQVAHFEALIHLGARWDTLLVARSMLETWVLLRWASCDRDKRGFEWQAFSSVMAWRDIQAAQHRGDAIDGESLAATKVHLKEHGRRFYSKSACNAEARGEALPEDPYIKNWQWPWGVKVKDLFKAVGEEAVYDDLYGLLSYWHHANPGGISLAVINRSGRTEFLAFSAQSALLALETGIACLIRTLVVCQDHFNLPADPDLLAWQKEYENASAVGL